MKGLKWKANPKEVMVEKGIDVPEGEKIKVLEENKASVFLISNNQ